MNATLVCVALLVPGYGEKEILKRIEAAGGQVFADGLRRGVSMPVTTTDADLGDLCELRGLSNLDLRRTQITDQGLRTVSGLRTLTGLRLFGTVVTDEGLRHLESSSNLEWLDLRLCPTSPTKALPASRKPSRSARSSTDPSRNASAGLRSDGAPPAPHCLLRKKDTPVREHLPAYLDLAQPLLV
jgi:hypothetical protein